MFVAKVSLNLAILLLTCTFIQVINSLESSDKHMMLAYSSVLIPTALKPERKWCSCISAASNGLKTNLQHMHTNLQVGVWKRKYI